MFGFGFGKLLVLVIIVAAVWYGFKLVGRLDRQRREKIAQKKKKGTDSVGKMEQCKICGTYVLASGTRNCGRPGCPY